MCACACACARVCAHPVSASFLPLSAHSIVECLKVTFLCFAHKRFVFTSTSLQRNLHVFHGHTFKPARAIVWIFLTH